MAENNNSNKIAHDRQTELLSDALKGAAEKDGVWLNANGKTRPLLHRQEVGVSAFNSLILGLHSDKHNYQTNLYTFYDDARKLGDNIREHEKGVPFNWYSWNKYVKRDDPTNVISKNVYKQLLPEEQKDYKAVRQRETRWLWNLDQTILPMTKERHYNGLTQKYGSKEARGIDVDDKRDTIAINDFILKMKDNLVDVRHEGNGLSYYDSNRDVVLMGSPRQFESNEAYTQELIRNVVAATGHSQRLARIGMVTEPGQLPYEDALKHEKLVQEIASAVKMQELGLPAKLTKDNQILVEYWTRELDENPKLLNNIEKDVNNALDMIHKAERGEKVQLATDVNKQKTQELLNQLPKHYFIAYEIKRYPDKEDKTFVVVEDKKNKSADVVLPNGASLEAKNELPGMSKERITRALKEQGFENVRFFNPDGALGYRPDDYTFAGKEVVIAKLDNWNLDRLHKLDISDALTHAQKQDYDKVQMVQDDNKNWMLFVKPEGKDGFAVYPEKNDINRFFTVLKQANATIDDVRVELADKYSATVKTDPSPAVDIFGKGQHSQEDLNRIQKVSLFKTQPDKIFIAATIEGAEKQNARQITPQQWQRMWLADDQTEYKKSLAATVFADVLQQVKEVERQVDDHKTEEVKHADYHEDEQNEKIKEDAAKQKQQEEEKKKQEEKKQEEKKKGDSRGTFKPLPKTSVLPRDWERLHQKHPDALLLWRKGDFYAVYKDQATKAAQILGITERENKDGLKYGEFPHHTLDVYLPKLIRAGLRVAICEDLPEQKKEVAQNKGVEENKTETQKQTHGFHL